MVEPRKLVISHKLKEKGIEKRGEKVRRDSPDQGNASSKRRKEKNREQKINQKLAKKKWKLCWGKLFFFVVLKKSDQE